MNPSSGQTSKTGKYNDKLPSGYRAGQIQQFTPEAMDLYKQLFSHVGPDSYLSKLAGGDEETFNQIEAPAYRDFSALQGNIASRFSGMGLGGRHSSGFQNQITAAGSNFAQDLQSRRHELSRNALKDLFDMSHTLLNEKPYERFAYEKEQSPWGPIAGKMFGPVAGYIGDRATGNKRYTGTQEGVNTSIDVVKGIAGIAGKAAGGG